MQSLPVIGRPPSDTSPRGVVGIISPWNYPDDADDRLRRGARLIAGNAVVPQARQPDPVQRAGMAELLYRAGTAEEFARSSGAGSVVGTAIIDRCAYLMFRFLPRPGGNWPKQCGRRLIGFSADSAEHPMIVTRGPTSTRRPGGHRALLLQRRAVVHPSADHRRTGHRRGVHRQVRRCRPEDVDTGYDFSADMGSLISEVSSRPSPIVGRQRKGATVVA